MKKILIIALIFLPLDFLLSYYLIVGFNPKDEPNINRIPKLSFPLKATGIPERGFISGENEINKVTYNKSGNREIYVYSGKVIEKNDYSFIIQEGRQKIQVNNDIYTRYYLLDNIDDVTPITIKFKDVQLNDTVQVTYQKQEAENKYVTMAVVVISP